MEILTVARIEDEVTFEELTKVLKETFGCRQTDIKFDKVECREDQIETIVQTDISCFVKGVLKSFHYEKYKKPGRCKTYISLPYTEDNANIIKKLLEQFGGWFIERDDVIDYVPIEKAD